MRTYGFIQNNAMTAVTQPMLASQPNVHKHMLIWKMVTTKSRLTNFCTIIYITIYAWEKQNVIIFQVFFQKIKQNLLQKCENSSLGWWFQNLPKEWVAHREAA